MRVLKLILIAIALWPAAPSWAQVSAPNAAGVSVGHFHYHVHDLDATKRFWVALGGVPARKIGTTDVIKFPGVLILLEEDEFLGGAEGSVIRHIGFRVPNLVHTLQTVEAAGYKVQVNPSATPPRTGYAFTPDGEEIEFFQDGRENVTFVLDGGKRDPIAERHNQTLTVPIMSHHIHFLVPEGKVAEAKTWYVKMFGAVPGKRWNYEAADLPGMNLNFSEAPGAGAPTKGRALDHIGLEVRNLEAFCKTLEARGVTLDQAYAKGEGGLGQAFLTDPWGTSIELTEGLRPQ
jgi:catechol 2,3-dioxygenase-like lactoylglutathione lyase family enzyme